MRRSPGVGWVCDGFVRIPVLYPDGPGVRPGGGWARRSPAIPSKTGPRRLRRKAGRPVLSLVLATAVLSGCHAAAPRPAAGPAAGTATGPAAGSASSVHLAAALVSPTDVTLSWNGSDPGAGWVVEFATEPKGQFAVLQFEPPGATTLRHPDLMPDTTFYYRVRPFYGPASAAVDVSLPPGDLDDNAHRDDPDWAAPQSRPDATAAKGSVRDAATAPGAAPSDLHATVMDANGIRFTWTDHATDEEGFLLEVRPAGAADYGVAAVLDPNVNTYGLVTLPTEKHASYRIRAFYYGQSSNLAQETTGHAG